MRLARAILICCCLTNTVSAARAADDAERTAAIAKFLAELDTSVFAPEERAAAGKMLERHLSAQLQAANDRSTAEWRAIDSREAWEKFREEKLARLKRSLNPSACNWHGSLHVESAGTVDGDGFVIERLLIKSRPGLWIGANLYRPNDDRKPTAPMPGIILSHSHHSPKSQSELQTMGMTWARLGATVLVIDHLGHGERRQHPFATAADYDKPFKVSRQDYYFRYDVELQLNLVGESLMFNLVSDLRCAVDMLLERPEIDRKRIILLGGVAGGGDPAAVTAALDERITAAVPFNFGGPQPENRYPLPEDSETSFPYAGGGSWESTRNLRQSASDGFLPWVIVGSIAPRGLIYGHEFSWDRAHDPVWKRLEKIYAWHDASDRLAFTHGAGGLRGQPPEATHCGNIGAPHRKLIYSAFTKWFDMPGVPKDEYEHPLPSEKLNCWTPELRNSLEPRLARELAVKTAGNRLRQGLAETSDRERWATVRNWWSHRLESTITPIQPKIVNKTQIEAGGGIRGEKLLVEIEPGIRVPVVLLLPDTNSSAPVVAAVSRLGKRTLLKQRGELIAKLLAGGVGLCLVDVRGTGETQGDDAGRDRTSTATSLSSTAQMLGDPLLDARLRDLRAVLSLLRQRDDVDGRRIAIWGDAEATRNAPNRRLAVPHGTDDEPEIAATMGDLLALMVAFYDKDLRAVCIRGGLASYAAALTEPNVCLPHDAVLPGALVAGDLPLLIGALAPLPLRMEAMHDGLNRALSADDLAKIMADAKAAYAAANASAAFSLPAESDASSAAKWLIEQLREN